MNSLKKLDRDYVKADRAAVVGLLDRVTEADFLTRMGLESRLREIDEQIAGQAEEPEEAHASAALFFGGRPVVGSVGIEAEFGSGAISTFQDLVTKILARNTTGLGVKGPVANKSAAAMHITNIVRGSFGFLLEEVRDQHQIFETSLKKAVEQASELLEAFGKADEEEFQTAVVEVDQRILSTARDFFELMRQNGATLKMIAGDDEYQFGADAVARGADRANATSLEEMDRELRGQLAGVLPGAHQFEFRVAGAETIKGKVDSAWTSEDLERWNRELVGVDAVAITAVKRVVRNGQVARETHSLKRIDKALNRQATG
ncbi:hypothetical protein [Mesorhizobium sp. YR577]|uniref:hypothetical protein n=1 Tax=Mesorhizobium sp. YR577 TaxID=1884373 RepID=UPI0008E2EC6D|nr:hypothetical protein [Mesorhizobium sp. YR577]SFU21013.1 hypothetical protein SAMN05518861_12534 [Mesorhizobium sp. YR577]